MVLDRSRSTCRRILYNQAQKSLAAISRPIKIGLFSLKCRIFRRKFSKKKDFPSAHNLGEVTAPSLSDVTAQGCRKKCSGIFCGVGHGSGRKWSNFDDDLLLPTLDKTQPYVPQAATPLSGVAPGF